MPKAVIQGETHLSRKDKRALMEFDVSEFDAVFREGHEKDYFQRRIDSLYALFAIGHLAYAATYSRLYTSIDEFQEKIEELDISFYDEIDAAIHETYGMVPRWKRMGLFLLSPVFAVILIGLITRPVDWVLRELTPELIPLLGYVGVIILLFTFSFLWALCFFLLIEGRVMYDRDEVMAGEILDTVEEEGYESILISCGDKHRPGIASVLRAEGWEVTEISTHSPIGKGLLWLDKISAAVLNPRRSFRKLGNWIRGS